MAGNDWPQALVILLGVGHLSIPILGLLLVAIRNERAQLRIERINYARMLQTFRLGRGRRR